MRLNGAAGVILEHLLVMDVSAVPHAVSGVAPVLGPIGGHDHRQLRRLRAVAVVRDAEVIERLLTGLDTNGRADLLAKGIIIRP